MKEKTIVLRYGHRPVRDDRVTTHCCLVARAFGAEKIIIFGKKDQKIEDTVKDVSKRWGGNFELSFSKNPLEEMEKMKKKGYALVHLTMYGKPVQKAIEQIKEFKKIAIIIGSKKVEPAVYEKSDFNIAITEQPHSEIAALAVFLDKYYEGKELSKKSSKKNKLLGKSKRNRWEK